MIATEAELRERIAHYKGLLRVVVDPPAVSTIANLITETETRLRRLEEKSGFAHTRNQSSSPP